MGDDLESLLRRLGVVKGTRNLKPAPDRGRSPASLRFSLPTAAEEVGSAADPQPIELLLPGSQLVETEVGHCLVLDHVYPLSHIHGDLPLAALPALPVETAAAFCRDTRLSSLGFEEFLFLDTETTGLHGAGTIAFMVGVAYFDYGSEQDQHVFVVRQYFLRDHADEPAMLYLLGQLLAEKPGLVTFNGRTFDLPLLKNRYLMQRMDDIGGDIRGRPHVDLLPLSRRLWRSRVGSCSLGSLEENLLGVQRTIEDVPGWAIPGIYMDYLRSGDARPLLRVFYHNRIDMLSMVTLYSRIIRQYTHPEPADPPLDLLSLAKWQIFLGHKEEAESNLKLVATQDLPLELYHQVLGQLGALLKRDKRREEAVPLWQQIAVTAFDDVEAHVELAMHYEWQLHDIETAHHWTRQALSLLNNSQAISTNLVRPELEHRLARLERKLPDPLDDD
jgi:uncharacterized protein YprB with RNaseH-like and TPR domain